MSSERHHPNEIIRFDIGWAIIVSLALVVHRHTRPDGPRVKLADHVYGVQAVVHFYRLVNQSYRLGRPVPERFNLHRLRSVASSKMLEGTQNPLTGSSQMPNPAPCCTGHKAKDMGGRTAGISAHYERRRLS